MSSRPKYLKSMVEKVKSVIRRLTWNLYHFIEENRVNNNDNFKNFGFINLVTSPQNKQLNAFKNGMYDMVRNLEFTNIRNKSIDNLNKDVESRYSSKNVSVFTDKSRNLYELSRKNYQKLLHRNITQTYRIASKNA